MSCGICAFASSSSQAWRPGPGHEPMPTRPSWYTATVAAYGLGGRYTLPSAIIPNSPCIDWKPPLKAPTRCRGIAGHLAAAGLTGRALGLARAHRHVQLNLSGIPQRDVDARVGSLGICADEGLIEGRRRVRVGIDEWIVRGPNP